MRDSDSISFQPAEEHEDADFIYVADIPTTPLADNPDPDKMHAVKTLAAGEVIAYALVNDFFPEKTDDTLILTDHDTHTPRYTARQIPAGHPSIIPLLITPVRAHAAAVHLSYRGTPFDGNHERSLDASGARSARFYQHSKNIVSAILEAVNAQHCTSDQPIKVTLSGHSLGGADAQNTLIELLRCISEECPHSEKIGMLQLLAYQSTGISQKAANNARNYVDFLRFADKLPPIECYWYQSAEDAMQLPWETRLFAQSTRGVETHLIKPFSSAKNPFHEFKYKTFFSSLNSSKSKSNLTLMQIMHNSQTHSKLLDQLEYFSTTAGHAAIIQEILTEKSSLLCRVQKSTWLLKSLFYKKLPAPAARIPSSALTALAIDALNVLESPAPFAADDAYSPHTRLLKNERLYNHDDVRFERILAQAQRFIKPNANGDITPAQLSRILNGDFYGPSDHLDIEIRKHIINLIDRRIVTDIVDLVSIDAEPSLIKWIAEQNKNFKLLYFYFDENLKVHYTFHRDAKTFMNNNSIDKITQAAILRMLETLTQITLELVCNKKNKLQDWLADPDTFGLAALCKRTEGSEQEQKMMPALLNAVLQVIAPDSHAEHNEHFNNLMGLIVILVQVGVLKNSSDLITTFTASQALLTPDEYDEEKIETPTCKKILKMP